MWIKTTSYDRSNADRIDESIAIKDVINYHLDDGGLSFDEIKAKFDIAAEAISTEGEITYINFSKVKDTVRERWVAEKRRIKEIRLAERMDAVSIKSLARS